MDHAADDITRLLARSESGDSEASRLLIDRIYADLRSIARARLRHEHAETIGTTGLVNEAWLAMARPHQAGFGSREHYFAYAAKAMRHILIDRARRRAADKRRHESMPTTRASPDASDLIAIDQALSRLGTLSPLLARVVELRLFMGLSSGEIGSSLGLTERTIERHWLKARTLLGHWLGQSDVETQSADR